MCFIFAVFHLFFFCWLVASELGVFSFLVQISLLALHAALKLGSLEVNDRLQSFCYVSIYYLSFHTILLLLFVVKPEIFIFMVATTTTFFFSLQTRILLQTSLKKKNIKILIRSLSFIYMWESMHCMFIKKLLCSWFLAWTSLFIRSPICLNAVYWILFLKKISPFRFFNVLFVQYHVWPKNMLHKWYWSTAIFIKYMDLFRYLHEKINGSFERKVFLPRFWFTVSRCGIKW